MLDTNVLLLLGRILFGWFFLVNGLSHFRHLSSMAGYAASKGVPMPRLAVGGTGTLLVIAGLGYLLGIYVFWAALAALVFFAGVTFKMHAY
jgi:uncharacterized membrane protein YphA (DoxX/SURF4 family)